MHIHNKQSARVNAPVRSAVDSILREFCKFDLEKQQWQEERQKLFAQISELKLALNEQHKEYELLLKRNKVLESSLNMAKKNG